MNNKIENQLEWIVEIPQNIVRNRELSHYAKVLYMTLASYTNDQGIAYPNIDNLKSLSCISSHNTITKYIRELQNKGYVEVVKFKADNGKYENNIYKLYNDKGNQCHKMTKVKKPMSSDRSHKMTNSIFSFNSINISMAQSLIENLETDKEGHSIKLLKVINKYKTELGETVFREKISYLYGKKQMFDSIESFAAYFGGIKKKEKPMHELLPEFNSETPGYLN